MPYFRVSAPHNHTVMTRVFFNGKCIDCGILIPVLVQTAIETKL